MSNKEIQTFQVQQYFQSSFAIEDYTLQGTKGLYLVQDFILKKSVSTEFQIVRKIKNYRLAWPLILSVSYEDDLVFVESEMPNLWGEGSTEEEALKSYEDYFIYDFKSYKNIPQEKLDFFARQEFKLYKALLNIS
jgi:hypothetical protein